MSSCRILQFPRDFQPFFIRTLKLKATVYFISSTLIPGSKGWFNPKCKYFVGFDILGVGERSPKPRWPNAPMFSFTTQCVFFHYLCFPFHNYGRLLCQVLWKPFSCRISGPFPKNVKVSWTIHDQFLDTPPQDHKDRICGRPVTFLGKNTMCVFHDKYTHAFGFCGFCISIFPLFMLIVLPTGSSLDLPPPPRVGYTFQPFPPPFFASTGVCTIISKHFYDFGMDFGRNLHHFLPSPAVGTRRTYSSSNPKGGVNKIN